MELFLEHEVKLDGLPVRLPTTECTLCALPESTHTFLIPISYIVPSSRSGISFFRGKATWAAAGQFFRAQKQHAFNNMILISLGCDVKKFVSACLCLFVGLKTASQRLRVHRSCWPDGAARNFYKHNIVILQ